MDVMRTFDEDSLLHTVLLLCLDHMLAVLCLLYTRAVSTSCCVQLE